MGLQRQGRLRARDLGLTLGATCASCDPCLSHAISAHGHVLPARVEEARDSRHIRDNQED